MPNQTDRQFKIMHIVECNADEHLNAAVEGGELLGFCSANPRTEERDAQAKARAHVEEMLLKST